MFHVFSLRALAVSATAVSALTLAAACGGGSDSPKESPTIQYKGTTASAPSGGSGNGGGGGEAQEVEVLMKDNFFEPKDLKVPLNTPIEFDTKNVGQAIHNMHVLSQAQLGKDYTSDAMVNPGKDSKFKVTFSKAGTYQFQCDYHVPDMVGTITVS